MFQYWHMCDNASVSEALKALLLKRGWIKSKETTFMPLTGGVSSEIYLVEDNNHRFVIKRALEKLRVEADWFADTLRNHSEQAFIRYVSEFRPECMPEILFCEAEEGLFAMEYLDGMRNWKQVLLEGRCDCDLAYKAGELLGQIHCQSWGDSVVLAQFDTIANFDQLRIDPYLRYTATQHPRLTNVMLTEAQRLMHSRQCLIHGDYSPKNILFNKDRLVPLDCEVACFADAAFDLSFFLNHLYLKSCFHAPKQLNFVSMMEAVRKAYRQGNPQHYQEVESNSVRLLPMLMLARVDGKSPVEYLNSQQQDLIRRFVIDRLSVESSDLDEFQTDWFNRLYN